MEHRLTRREESEVLAVHASLRSQNCLVHGLPVLDWKPLLRQRPELVVQAASADAVDDEVDGKLASRDIRKS